MDTKKMKTVVFPSQTLKDWEGKVEESMKGKRIDRFSSNTYEGIQLNPLYTRENTAEPDPGLLPGMPDYRRGGHAGGYLDQPWELANRLSFQTTEELEKKVEAALAGGQTAIAFEVDGITPGLSEWLISALGTHGDRAICIRTGPHDKELLHALYSDGSSWNVTGFIGSDPVADAAARGGFSTEAAEELTEWEGSLKAAGKAFPAAKTIIIDLSPYHNAGANAVQELGIALAEGVYYIDRLQEKGWDAAEIVSRMVFHFQVGSNFFMELAKFRAARILWSKVTEVYGVSQEGQKMTISAETSHFTKTVHDPYVNLLRAGSEAFAAILGGVQYLSVGKVDDVTGGSSSFTERIARNTQLILREETHVDKVVDPGGGSWYIESLTKEIAEKAWSFFLEIEAKNGIVESLKENWLQGQLEEVMGIRRMDAFTRKQSIIGTNVYAQPDEKARPVAAGRTVQSGTQFKPLSISRLSVPYENLRMKAAQLEENGGSRPTVGLICLEELKQHKARADFMAGFLAAGGIRTSWSDGIESAGDAVEFARRPEIQLLCLCGTDEQYARLAAPIVSELVRTLPPVSIYLAGKPSEELQETLASAGIKGYIHAKSNQYELLFHLLNEMEAASDGKKA